MEMANATREIMWNIPYSFKIAMYLLFVISLVVMFYGLREKYRFITYGGKQNGLNGLFPKKSQLNWSAFFQTLFFQGKVSRNRDVGLFHALIYYGFIILWVATDLVAIHYDTPFKVFQGTTYIVISFLADIAGIAIILGIILAYYRRYIVKPDYLNASQPKRELFMYITLLNLVIVGYLIEGLRLMGTNAMEREMFWAPIGFLIANFFSLFTFQESIWAVLYRFLWFIHMLATMVFVASIGYSKFSHFLFAPLSALITPKRRSAILDPMNFEDEEAETFGLGKSSELTAKNRFDLLSCVECGRCTESCPAHLAGKILNPKTIITKMRDHLMTKEIQKSQNDLSFWDNNNSKAIYQSNELDACTTCGACMEECPVNIEHVGLIMELKRYKVLTLGEIPEKAADAINKIKINGNPWGISQDDRFKWAEGIDVPIASTGKRIDYLYYVGCAGAYDPANQKVVKDTIQLFKKANVNFAVIGKTEKCNGDPIRRFGDEYSFSEVAIENISNIRKYEFDKIVTHCPHCLHTIGKEYAKFENGNFTVLHHTELLNELLDTGKLKPEKRLNEGFTFHDPCYLGRHHGAYEAPRKILESISGLELKEMEESKDRALCCGMGGGNMWYELPEGDHLANNRLDHIAATQQKKLATACSYCLINFNSAKGHNKETEELEIEDVASILARSVL